MGWQGFAPPPIQHVLPSSAAARALCQAAPPLCTSHVKCGQAPRLPREEEEGSWEARFPELGCEMHHPISQKPTSPPWPSPAQPQERGLRQGGVITAAWGGRAECRGSPAARHIPGRLEAPAAPRSFWWVLEACLSVRVLLYYVSAYKSTLLWVGGGGSAEDRCSCVNAVSILSPLGD